jgi:aspartyl-tRNA(Asn)/glutamyl-tRNA(Gln) amidotransferase subunit A
MWVDVYLDGNTDIGLHSLTGHPCAVLPYTFGQGDNLQPICTTIIGNLFADDKILSVASAYQQATDWHKRRPKVSPTT